VRPSGPGASRGVVDDVEGAPAVTSPVASFAALGWRGPVNAQGTIDLDALAAAEMRADPCVSRRQLDVCCVGFLDGVIASVLALSQPAAMSEHAMAKDVPGRPIRKESGGLGVRTVGAFRRAVAIGRRHERRRPRPRQ